MEKNTWKKIEYTAIVEFIKEKNLNPIFQQLTGKIRKLLVADQDYQYISNCIKPSRDKDAKVQKLYAQLRDKLLEGPEEQVRKGLELYQKESKLPCEPLSNPSGSGLLGYLWKPTDSITVTEKIVEEKFRKAHEMLEHHDRSARGWTKLNLCRAIRSMPFKNDFELSIKNFIEIHKYILQKKFTKLNDLDKCFVDKYSKKILDIKTTSPIYRDMLFYGYPELIDFVRARNRAFLRNLFSMEEK